MKFVVTPQTTFTSAGAYGGTGDNDYGSMPNVQFFGLSATTILTIKWAYVLEVIPLNNCPLEIQASGFEPEFLEICHEINDKIPWNATGSSFSSFIRDIWDKMLASGRWVLNNRDTLASIGSLVAKTVA